MRRDSKKGKLMYSVSVYPCLSQTVCALTFCMWLHCFDMLSCPELRMTTASSSSWGDSPTSFFTWKYSFVMLCLYQRAKCACKFHYMVGCGISFWTPSIIRPSIWVVTPLLLLVHMLNTSMQSCVRQAVLHCRMPKQASP